MTAADLTDAQHLELLIANAEPTETKKTGELRARLLSSAELDQLPPPEPVLDGILYRDSLVELYGRPGCGKSFLGLDWALSVAAGKPWQQHTTHPGHVLYVVGEGISGIGKRRRAWQYAWGTDPTARITWLRGAVPLLDPGWLHAFTSITDELRPALVVVDTVSRSIPGHNENAPETMSGLVDAFDRIRAASHGACVLAIHHATKDGNTTRGHSALEGAADVRWKLVKDDSGLLTLSNPKAKDDAEAPDQNLRLKVIDLAERDAWGAPLTSCVIESHGPSLSPDERTASEERLLDVMRDTFGTTGATGAQLRDTADLPRSTHYRALNALVSSGALRNSGTQQRPFYVLAEEPTT